MLYQLSSGKVISISIEDYLSMTDETEQILIAQNAGHSIHAPFFDSAISKKVKRFSEIEADNEIVDLPLDYDSDSDELDNSEKIDINNIPDEDGITDL